MESLKLGFLSDFVEFDRKLFDPFFHWLLFPLFGRIFLVVWVLRLCKNAILELEDFIWDHQMTTKCLLFLIFISFIYFFLINFFPFVFHDWGENKKKEGSYGEKGKGANLSSLFPSFLFFFFSFLFFFSL